jgi:uncharacterized protein DUF6265
MESSHTPPRTPSWSCSLSVVALALCVSVSPISAQTRPTDALGWMAGCWQWERGSTLIEEQWLPPKGGILLGAGRTIRRDTVVEYEFVRIYSAGDTLVYDAHPSGQAPAEFRATPPFVDAVTFSNPAHDFPQRVIYRRVGSDTLLARVEGIRNGQLRGIDFPYRRVACGPKTEVRD